MRCAASSTRADAAADRANGMNTCSATLSDDVHHRVAVVGGRGDVEEHQLVGTFRVVPRGQLDRVSGVADLHEAHALDHPARVDVEARDHADGEHAGDLPSWVDSRTGGAHLRRSSACRRSNPRNRGRARPPLAASERRSSSAKVFRPHRWR